MADRMVYGHAPVQGEGEVDGHPWYFRARHTHWEFAVAEPDGDPVAVCFGDAPGWYTEARYGTGDHDASWMEHEVARVIVSGCLTRFRAGELARREEGAPRRGAPPPSPPGANGSTSAVG